MGVEHPKPPSGYVMGVKNKHIKLFGFLRRATTNDNQSRYGKRGDITHCLYTSRYSPTALADNVKQSVVSVRPFFCFHSIF